MDLVRLGFLNQGMRIVNYILIIVVTLSIYSCGIKSKDGSASGTNTDKRKKSGAILNQIKENKTLRVVVDYNSTNYFVYRARPMGFQYELLKRLAADLDVKLEIVISNNLQETFSGVNEGRYDLIAKNLTVTKKRSRMVNFTHPLQQTHQVLVQRNVDNEGQLIRNQLDLAGKTIYVQKNTSYYRRLVNLSEEIGKDIDIRQDTIYGVEQLVALVAKGEIDYTVCDENVAMVNRTYYPNLDIATPISFSQNIAWAVRKGSKEWLKYLNNWIEDFVKSPEYEYIYFKYFLSPRTKRRVNSEFHSIAGGKISDFDQLIQEKTKDTPWDWRLVSSIIYVESGFELDISSWVGAVGLMQIMPETAEFFKIDDLLDPSQNIDGGIRILNWLDEYFTPVITDPAERIHFVLASYNVGLGHVKDAQRLAKKYGKDPNIWKDNVDFYLLNKSSEKYYKDEVVRWGYCRGEEPYEYVRKVLDNFHHYENLIPA